MTPCSPGPPFFFFFFLFHLIDRLQMSPFQCTFHFGKKAKVTGLNRVNRGCLGTGMHLSTKNCFTVRALKDGAFSWCRIHHFFHNCFSLILWPWLRTLSTFRYLKVPIQAWLRFWCRNTIIIAFTYSFLAFSFPMKWRSSNASLTSL
jgi:hypothetical protein